MPRHSNAVMNAEKYAEGLTFAQYLATVQVNADAFRQGYGAFTLSGDDADWFRGFVERKGGTVHMAVIAEDWCPDVVRGLPVAVRIAEAAGMAYRIFPRSQHLDLMDRYLWRRAYMAIPVVVFFTDDWRELGHWIERPAFAYRQIAEIADALRELPEHERQEHIRARHASLQTLWTQETVRELRELLSRAM
ncbi:MAG: thioredoxin family protein [Chloroflexi bacterium]|nr:thioredoxin family protein [Chloroflexota bacterium]